MTTIFITRIFITNIVITTIIITAIITASTSTTTIITTTTTTTTTIIITLLLQQGSGLAPPWEPCTLPCTFASDAMDAKQRNEGSACPVSREKRSSPAWERDDGPCTRHRRATVPPCETRADFSGHVVET
ncbi:hypothetical protein RJ55_00762 [Drechmeria coniospora]|nr:hypothetical protein RJ55_00762 [Drechmeria coniospora]